MIRSSGGIGTAGESALPEQLLKRTENINGADSEKDRGEISLIKSGDYVITSGVTYSKKLSHARTFFENI